MTDRRFFLRWTVLALALLTLPYAVMAVLAPAAGPGRHVYTGLLYDPSDTFLYVSQMVHAHLGEWSFTDYFTYIHEKPLFIFPLYTLLGKLTPGSGGPISAAVAFHAARVAIALLFCHQVWRLYGELLPGRGSRRVAFLFVLFTAGFGVFNLLVPAPLKLQEVPFDLSFIESSTYYGLVYSPHFAAVLLLLVVWVRAFYRAQRADAWDWRAAAIGVLAGAALSTIHPEKVGILALGGGLYWAWTVIAQRPSRAVAMRRAGQLFLMVAGGLPYVAYAYLLTVHDVQIAQLLRQGRPHPVILPDSAQYYLSGYGFPGLLALSSLPRIVRRLPAAPPGEVLLWTMIIGSLVLLLTPWRTLDHRAEGLQVFVAGLAGRQLLHAGLPRFWRTRGFLGAARRHVFGYSRRRLRILSLNLVIILSSPSVLALAIAAPRAGLADASELYMTGDDVNAVAWLRQHAARDQVVVSGPESGQFVASYAGTHVVFGEWAFTPNFESEALQLYQFFHGQGDPSTYLRSRSVDWLYFGPREQLFGGSLDARTRALLEPAFQSGSTQVYRVRR